MLQQHLDYEPPGSGPKRLSALVGFPLTAFVAIELLTDFLLIGIGTDHSPGSWGDLIALVLNPGVHAVLVLVFLIGSLFRWRRSGPFALYVVAALLLPLTGAFVVYGIVKRH